jgi:K+-transporting ATPase ATPase C chain
MIAQSRPALVLIVFFTLVTGLLYPLAVTGFVQIALPSHANGSLVSKDGAVVGSALIGQRFTSDRYFHGRPSAAGTDGYDAATSSGSNLGPLSKKLLDRIQADVATLRRSAGSGAIPGDAVTTSASGLDPHISPEFAELQVSRVAAARRVDAADVRQVLQRYIEHPFLGIFGEPRVNVLALNIALDAAIKPPAG